MPFGVPLAALAEIIDVIPAFLVEGVGDDRRAKQKAHLTAGHADLNCIDIVIFQQVALLHVDPIDAAA